MKKKILACFLLVILLVILSGVVFCLNFYDSDDSVQFTDNHAIGDISKFEDETVVATIFTGIYNGSTEERTVTFDIKGGIDYYRGILKYHKFDNVQIEVREGTAYLNAQRDCITILPGETVRLTITAENIYAGNKYQGERMGIRRAAPRNVRIVPVDLAATEMERPETVSYNISKEGEKSVLTVTDNQGNELYSDTFETGSDLVVKELNQDTIEIIYGRKSDVTQSLFINGRTGQVSPLIDNVYASNGQLAVNEEKVDGQIKIIIRDIYDIGNRYEEVIDTSPLLGLRDAKFLDNGQIEITYSIYQDAGENAEHFAIKTVIVAVDEKE